MLWYRKVRVLGTRAVAKIPPTSGVSRANDYVDELGRVVLQRVAIAFVVVLSSSVPSVDWDLP